MQPVKKKKNDILPLKENRKTKITEHLKFEDEKTPSWCAAILQILGLSCAIPSEAKNRPRTIKFVDIIMTLIAAQ